MICPQIFSGSRHRGDWECIISSETGLESSRSHLYILCERKIQEKQRRSNIWGTLLICCVWCLKNLVFNLHKSADGSSSVQLMNLIEETMNSSKHNFLVLTLRPMSSEQKQLISFAASWVLVLVRFLASQTQCLDEKGGTYFLWEGIQCQWPAKSLGRHPVSRSSAGASDASASSENPRRLASTPRFDKGRLTPFLARTTRIRSVATSNAFWILFCSCSRF